MVARLMPTAADPVRPVPRRPITIVVDGNAYTGEEGQTLAGLMLANGVHPRRGAAAGMSCGIGVCFGCTATVNGIPDVRTCQRPAVDGAVVDTGTSHDG